MRMMSGVAALAVMLVATGCAAQDAGIMSPLSSEDTAALAVLAEVAGPTSGIDADAVTATECWLPSDHPLEDAGAATVWRVLCRVHYEESGATRYRDTTCIGDFALDPMLDHCYRWAHYSNMPGFEDHPAVVAGGS